MRTLLAIAIVGAGMVSLDSTADAARKSKTKAQDYSQQKSVDVVCEERAQHEDPSGQYAGYPCWAREVFAQGRKVPR